MEDQVLYSNSVAAASKLVRMRLCSSVRKSVENGLDHTPVGERTEKSLQDYADCMYRATEFTHQLNTMR